jgi:4a-hydroxytetrahydrobiopterin dehydratase
MTKLSDAEIQKALTTVPEWSEVSEAIQRTFQLPDFVRSMKFVGQVAEIAEAMNHHPDILIRYNKVTLTLATHDAGGITGKDFEQARKIDGVFGGMAGAPVVAVGGKGGKKSKA